MGGENPYIEQTEAPLPTKSYTIRFTSDGEELKTIQVDPNALPERGDGRPGCLLRIAHAGGVEIDHACGGVVACSTCHVVLNQKGFDSTNEASEDEEDMIDLAPGIKSTSRLACQCVPDGSSDLVVEIPSWNRNAVQEGH